MNELTPHRVNWLDAEVLIEILVSRFRNSLKKVLQPTAAPTEPTLAIARAAFTGEHISGGYVLDIQTSLTKTLQNAIGLVHQDVLGSCAGWQSTGASAGVIDVRGVSPVTGEDIVAEVKMRHNTIKASDEKNVFDSLKNAAAGAGFNTTAYLFQIIPPHTQIDADGRPLPYDKQWVPSGRTPSPRVRVADGVTAYHLVTGSPTALYDLYQALPWALGEAVYRLSGSYELTNTGLHESAMHISELMEAALPGRSAHA